LLGATLCWRASASNALPAFNCASTVFAVAASATEMMRGLHSSLPSDATMSS
jgi:hypothetical protein